MSEVKTKTAEKVESAVEFGSMNYIPDLQVQSENQSVVDANLLTEEEKKIAQEIADKVDFTDGNTLALFGKGPMNAFNEVINQLLQGVKIKDVSGAGDIALGIAKALDVMKVKEMRKELTPGTLAFLRSKIPFIGKRLSYMYYFYKRHQEFTSLTEKMERDANKKIREILENLLKADHLNKAVEEKYNQLRVFIVAGEIAMKRAQQEFDDLRAQAIDSNDSLLFSKANSLHENIMMFDTRLLKIKIAYAKSPVTGQQIRLGQTAGRSTMSNLQNAIDFTLRDIKTTVLQIANLTAMKEAQLLSDKMSQIDDQVSVLNQKMLEDTYLGAKRVEGEGLKYVNQLADLMEQVSKLHEKGAQIDRENIQKRKEAEEILIQAQKSYKETMKNLGQSDTF